MEELESLKSKYDDLMQKFGTVVEERRRKENECYELKRENDRLWKLVENLSIALKGDTK